jgi:hypothetical protein
MRARDHLKRRILTVNFILRGATRFTSSGGARRGTGLDNSLGDSDLFSAGCAAASAVSPLADEASGDPGLRTRHADIAAAHQSHLDSEAAGKVVVYATHGERVGQVRGGQRRL